MSKKSLQRKRKIYIKLSKVFLFIGILCLIYSGYLFYQRNNPDRLSFANSGFNQVVTTSSIEPKKIIIKDINLDLAIYPSKITGNKWGVTEDGVSRLVSSPIPGEDGNSILYGHNWSNLLGGITKLKPNQEILITYKDGSVKKFVITNTAVVSPEDTAVLAPSKNKKITLYTCTGFFDSKRFVVTAELI